MEKEKKKDEEETSGPEANGSKKFKDGEYDCWLVTQIGLYLACCECACLRRNKSTQDKNKQNPDTGIVDRTQPPERERCVLLIGDESSGKSCFVERAKTDSWAKLQSTPPPTNGFSIVDVKYRETLLRFWDLGGSSKVRRFWSRYLPQAHAVLYMIDGQAEPQPDRMSDSLEILRRFLEENPQARRLPLAVVVGKADSTSLCRISQMQVEEALKVALDDLLPDRFLVALVSSCPDGELDKVAAKALEGNLNHVLDWINNTA